MPTAPVTSTLNLRIDGTDATVRFRRSRLGCVLIWTDDRWVAAYPAVWEGDQA